MLVEEVGVRPNIWYKVKVRNEKNDVLDALQVAEGHHAAKGHGNNKKHH